MATLTIKRLASILGTIIGVLSIVAGSKVLLGISYPNYTVLQWLVIYNVLLGTISLIGGVGLWGYRSWAILLAGLITTFHSFILVMLFAMFLLGKAVAIQSILAMLFRTMAWLGIFVVTRKK